MIQSLQDILNSIQQSDLGDAEKAALVKAVKAADKEYELVNFKLDRTEKVKRTTAILLEETIQELELKRKAVESQNHELEIETALERVRAIALSMQDPTDMLEVCRTISDQFRLLGVKEIRNVQTAIIYESKGTYLNFEYYARHDKDMVTEVHYDNHPMSIDFVQQMLQDPNGFYTSSLNRDELLAWYNFQKTTNQFADTYLENADSLNYYWNSAGPVALGISTYQPLSVDEVELFKRFRNVFGLAYRRYLDIEIAQAQAREARIEASLEKVRAVAMSMHTSEHLLNVCEVLFYELNALGFTNIRNTIIDIYDDEKKYKLNYDYSDVLGKAISHVPYNVHPFIEKQIKEIRSGEDAFSETVFTGQELDSWKEFRRKSGQQDDPRVTSSSTLHYYFFSISKGSIGISTFGNIDSDQLSLLKRFRNVFTLSYQRYTDIALAEGQAREAQIQLGLERVRARTMAMQRSDELTEASAELYRQLTILGEPAHQLTIGIIKEDEGVVEVSVTLHGNKLPQTIRHPISEPYLMQKMYDAWKAGKKTFILELRGEELIAYNQFRNNLVGENLFPVNLTPDSHRIISFANFSKGTLAVATDESRPAESLQLLERFAGVFDLTYTRFLDLQKAEAQAREARIEASLERVRSRAMAMQNSGELGDLVATVFAELTKLEFNITSSIIWIHNSELNSEELWAASPEHNKPARPIHLKSFYHPFFKSIINAWKERDQQWIYTLTGQEKQAFEELFFYDVGNLPEGLKTALTAHEKVIFSASFSRFGAIEVLGVEALSDDKFEILHRIGRVFDSSYTRFNDLKQAEAQAREAQIELALERVRARTMAMQRSDELPETAQILFQQFKELGENPIQITIGIFKEEQGLIEFSVTDWGGAGKQIDRMSLASIEEPTLMQKIYKAWKANQKSVVIDLTGQELLDWVTYRNSLSGTEDQQFKLHDRRVVHVGLFSKGLLSFSTHEPRPAESVNVLERFAAVFQQTYTRFLDLQKAEAQAREAQVETALERVRSRSMAMQVSEELKEVIRVVFEQLVQLNIHVQHAGFIVDYKENEDMHLWIASSQAAPGEIRIPYFDSEHWNSFNDAKEKGIDFFANHLDFDAKNKFYQTLFQYIPEIPEEDREYFLTCPGLAISTVLLDNIGLYIENFSGLPYSENENAILMRFGKVFQQTYTRFLDLQRSEAQARESQIEAALERVRSRTLAMQKSDELAETAAVLFRQLISLGIQPNRLYITIIKDQGSDAEFWITDEDGSRVSTAFHTDMLVNPTFKKMLDGWKSENKTLIIDMQGEELENYFRHLNTLNVPFKDGLKQKRRVQHIAFFSKGFIGMASPDEQPAETMQLLERFASVFNLTFTRFNDLIVAEQHAKQAEEDLQNLIAEKKRTEDALHDLRTTQAQLIQAEKMASLGQLTAGIAHEIQNPLNFVNNFSEVNSELIEELQDELAKGNMQLANELASDIKDNEQKIVHHGKRADAIVKSMLQHSRTGSGQKELTDINAMADEYLRLAYHGMRAKDKSFNVDYKLDLDPKLPKIMVMPQEIGRVLLNLINNAFQALNSAPGFAPYPPEGGHKKSPIVSVVTKQIPPLGGRGQNSVQISISDNGPGIPESIKDKIFQPFFTTKPAGQGTGLGLSLSYDIIKAHGGELKVETKEGEGTTFTIRIPQNGTSK